jgi:hypothetical protein
MSSLQARFGEPAWRKLWAFTWEHPLQIQSCQWRATMASKRSEAIGEALPVVMQGRGEGGMTTRYGPTLIQGGARGTNPRVRAEDRQPYQLRGDQGRRRQRGQGYEKHQKQQSMLRLLIAKGPHVLANLYLLRRFRGLASSTASSRCPNSHVRELLEAAGTQPTC